jgi:hypothetical protein
VKEGEGARVLEVVAAGGFVNGLDTASRSRALSLSLSLSLCVCVYAHTMSPHSHPSIGRIRRKACVTTLSLTCVSVSPLCPSPLGDRRHV